MHCIGGQRGGHHRSVVGYIVLWSFPHPCFVSVLYTGPSLLSPTLADVILTFDQSIISFYNVIANYLKYIYPGKGTLYSSKKFNVA